MAEEQLTGKQRIALSATIAASDLVKIGIAYFELGNGVIKNIKAKHPGDVEAQSEEMINLWSNKNPKNQVKKLASILYDVAEEYGWVDPIIVEKILKVTKEESEISDTGPAPIPNSTASFTGAAASTPSPASKELTDSMKINLAKRIVSNGDLTELGINGFGLEDFVVATALKNNNNDINGAARQIIKEWSETYGDLGKAYEDLCTILKKMKKAAWINALR